jgi:hypothetical protein
LYGRGAYDIEVNLDKDGNRKVDYKMVKHIVSYRYADGFTVEENERNAQKMKEELEGLVGVIDGLISLKVLTNPLETSEADLLLDSVLVDNNALQAYQAHPEHVRVAANYVRPFIKDRKCLDFEM